MSEPIRDMTAEELRHIARKLRTYVAIYTGDKEARRMAKRCDEIADLLDAVTAKSENDRSARERCAKFGNQNLNVPAWSPYTARQNEE